MPVKADAFCQTLAQVIKNEHRFLLEVNQEGVFTLPKNILQYVCAKAIYMERENIFSPATAEWSWKSGNKALADKPIVFNIKEQNKETHFLFADIFLLNQDDDLLLALQSMLHNVQPHKKLAAIIFKSTEKQAQVWKEKWQDKIGSILKPCHHPVEISDNLWLSLWEDADPSESADVHVNADIALEDAIHSMYFESMFQVLRKIISLRTNLDESALTGQTNLYLIFKMVFAKEQGVPLDEVYDPEAMAGFTDSQLARSNFLSDIQKTFNIDFSEDDISGLDTINDLVDLIIFKKAS